MIFVYQGGGENIFPYSNGNGLISSPDGNQDEISKDSHNAHNNTHTVGGSYAKSFRHFTREALPRLDNYRNMMSIQAAYRPTLDELHNITVHRKVIYLFLINRFFARRVIAKLRLKAEDAFLGHTEMSLSLYTLLLLLFTEFFRKLLSLKYF